MRLRPELRPGPRWEGIHSSQTPCSWNAGLNGAVAGTLKMQEWKKQERQRMESRKKRKEKKSRAYKIPTT